MSESIDHDKMCLRFNKKREEGIITRLNQRKIKIILVKLLIRLNEKRLKYNLKNKR